VSRWHRLLLAIVAASPPLVARAESVPFVGCPSEGQAGAAPAPPSGPVPRVAGAAARHLAYYRSETLAVLAPRGWHCLALRGPDGASLLVTRDPFEAADWTGQRRYSGPAVQLSVILPPRIRPGEPATRSGHAEFVARYFPLFLDRVRHLASVESLREPLPWGPYPEDRIRRRSASWIAYVTPPGREGLGTSGALAPAGLPIRGWLRFAPDDGLSLLKLHIRLPRRARNVEAAIQRQVLAGLAAERGGRTGGRTTGLRRPAAGAAAAR